MGGTAQSIDNMLEGLDLAHLSREDVESVLAQGLEASVFLVLTLSPRLAKLQTSDPVTPSTPSSQIPPFKKPNTTQKRHKTPGRKTGHAGVRRKTPPCIDRTEEHKLEHCPQCRTLVEPVVPDAMPQAQLGHRVVTLSAWLHYGLGNTLSQITQVFNSHLQMQVSPGGLVSAWHRLANVFMPWYDEIAYSALHGAVLHADETGHRINGQTHWLWCFTNGNLTYYQIDRSRGYEALQRFFHETFQGTLITDFWAAYKRVAAGKRQMCLVHLLRELETVDQHNSCSGLDQLTRETSSNPDVTRLVKRLDKYRQDLLTFLDEPGLPFDNNLAEREIRPAVLMRKNSFHNMSQDGAITQAVLMTIYRTLKLRGHDSLETIVSSLRHYLSHKFTLPPLPSINIPSDG